MATDSIWYHHLTLRDPSVVRDPLAVLARTGLALHPHAPAEPPGPGILFFEVIDPELLELLRELSRDAAERVVAIATDSSVLSAGAEWQLLRAGASEVIAWANRSEPAAEVAARFARWAEIDRLVASPLVQNHLIGQSRCWTTVLRHVVEVARFTQAPVLILGESGTGKELIARLIHTLDARSRKRELVVLDCATIAPELAGSELFGHERGAFTGAVGAREGAFALANAGTLFLDEIGDLPLHLQVQLLRAVQERTYKRVGGNSWQKTDFRLVCATHRPLLAEVGQGAFRADLYYRIAGVTCHVPSLRDRPEDIVPLFQHFLAEFCGRNEPPELDEPVRHFLLRREYPGNVRDLRQLAARVAYRHVGPGPITVGDLPEDERPHRDGDDWRDVAFEGSIRRALVRGVGLKEIGRLAADTAIRIAMYDAKGSLQQAALRLGVTDRALQMRRAAEQRSGTPPAGSSWPEIP